LGRESNGLAELGVGVLLVGPGGRGAAALVSRVLRSPFPVCADADRRAYRALGLARRLTVQESGSFLVDRSGTIRYARHALNPHGALDPRELVEAAAALGQVRFPRRR